MNISGLSVVELRALQEQIKQEIKKREQQDVAKAREQILAIAQSVGIPIMDLINGNARLKSIAVAKVAIRYQHPKDATLHWTGRGRQPLWVKDWLASGQSIDALRIS